MQLAQPRVRLVAAQPRLATQPRSGARHCQRAARLLPRAQQQGGGEAAEAAAEAAAAVAEQQAAAQAYQSAAEAAQEEVEELKAAAVAHTAEAASVSAEQRAAYQAAPTPEPPAPRRAGLPLNLLQHPAVRVAGAEACSCGPACMHACGCMPLLDAGPLMQVVSTRPGRHPFPCPPLAVCYAGISAAVFLGGTFLLTLWRTSRDPQKRRKSTVNKNKVRGWGWVGRRRQGVWSAGPALWQLRTAAAVCVMTAGLVEGCHAHAHTHIYSWCLPHPCTRSSWSTPAPSSCPATAPP